MDMEDIYDFAPLAAFFLWTFIITPMLPPEQRPILGPLGMIIPILFMVALEHALKWMAAEYNHILAICRPSNVQLDLFYNLVESREIQPGLYSTKLSLGERVKHPYWQIMQYLVIKHWNTWEDRIEFTKRKVKFKGEWVTHSKSAVITLYEEGTSDIDHLQPIPTFLLTEAPRDFYDPEDYYREIVAPMQMINGGQQMLQGLTQEEKFDRDKMRRENAALRSENVELERQSLDYHNKWIKGERVIKHLKNELYGYMSGESEQQPAVVEQVLKALVAHVDIHEALKSVRGRWGWIDKRIVMIALAAIAVIVFMLNPEPLATVLQNNQVWLFAVIVVIVIGAVVYYSRRR